MTTTTPAVIPSAGVSRSNDTDAASPIAADRPEQQEPVQPEERQPVDRELVEDAGDRRADDRPEHRREDADRDERQRRDEERHVDRAARERPGEEDLERAALALAGDGGRRENPTAKTEFRISEIGWIAPRAIEPDKREDVAAAELRQLLRDQPGLDDVLERLAERAVDDRQQRAPDRQRDEDDQHLQPLGAPRLDEQDAAHAGGSGPRRLGRRGGRPARRVVVVQLEERLLEVGRLDRQVDDAHVADRREERPDVALEVARDPAVRRRPRPRSRRRRRRGPAAGPSTRISTFRLRRASSASTSSSATSRPRRTIATRSQTRSTSDRTCDEKKIVRPAARSSSRIA